MRLFLAIALAAALVVSFGSSAAVFPGAAIAADRDCSDFDSQRQAQRFYKRHGPGDPHGLDGDNDGKACEELPCPCGSGGGGGGGGNAAEVAIGRAATTPPAPASSRSSTATRFACARRAPR